MTRPPESEPATGTPIAGSRHLWGSFRGQSAAALQCPRSSVASSVAYEIRKCVSRRLKTPPGTIKRFSFTARATNSLPVPRRRFWKRVKRATRPLQFVVPGEASDDEIAFAAVVGDVRAHVEIKGRGGRPLKWLRGADERVLLELRHLVDHRRGAVHNPSRQPVIAWLLEKPSTTIVCGLNLAGDRNGPS